MSYKAPLFIGIDAGGTHSTAWAQTRLSSPESFEGPPANPNRLGVPKAAKALAAFIKEIASRFTPGCALHVVMGVAGLGRPATKTPFRSHLSEQFVEHPLETLTLYHDAELALDAAHGGMPGLVVIAGTGSVVYARTPSGDLLKAGGWGYLLGDEGSGYQIGLEGLRAVIAAMEAGPETRLSRLLLDQYQLGSSDAIAQAVYQEHWPPQQMAPLVLQAAQKGDTVALELLLQQSQLLAHQVQGLTVRGGFLKPSVALWGGLTKDPFYYATLTTALMHLIPQGRIVPVQQTPAEWALHLAQSRFEESAS